jgi:hypothetical protein
MSGLLYLRACMVHQCERHTAVVVLSRRDPSDPMASNRNRWTVMATFDTIHRDSSSPGVPVQRIAAHCILCVCVVRRKQCINLPWSAE